MDDLQIKTYSPKHFEELENAWKALEKGSEMTAFQQYNWFKNINALYFREHIKKVFRKWRYILVTENDKPVMIAPIQIVKIGAQYKNIGVRRGAYFIGRQGYTDYLNFIYDTFSDEAVKAIFSFIKEKYHVNYFCFEQLLDNTSLNLYITQHYKYQQTDCYAASLTLPATFDEYNKRRTRHSRQNLRTAINRQKRDNLMLTHELVTELSDDELDILMRIRSQRLKDKRKNQYKNASLTGQIYNRLRDGLCRMVDAKHDVIHESGPSWAFLVKDKDRIVGFFWGIKNDEKGEYYVILAGVDKDYAWYSPSLSHLYLFIQEQYEAGDNTVKVLDFTRGIEKYKTDIGGVKKDAWTVTFRLSD